MAKKAEKLKQNNRKTSFLSDNFSKLKKTSSSEKSPQKTEISSKKSFLLIFYLKSLFRRKEIHKSIEKILRR